MDAALRATELQRIVDGTEVSTAATAAEWLKHDSKSISIICAAVDRKILEHVIQCKTAKGIWDKNSLDSCTRGITNGTSVTIALLLSESIRSWWTC